MNRHLSAASRALSHLRRHAQACRPRAVLMAAACMSALTAAPLHASETPPAAKPAPATLDLRVPRITELYTPEQIHQLLAGTFADIEEIQVEGAREPLQPMTPQVWRGLFAPIWAMLNPSQAWRILAPLPPDQTRAADEPFDATSGYLEPAAPPQPR